jgi:HEAT repeat protein
MIMPKRVQIALAVVLVALAGVMLWQVSPPREPVYEGKRLRRWLKAYATPGGPEAFADEAVRQAGTNAIPRLLSLLRFEDSALKVKFMDLMRQQHIITIEFTTAAAWNWVGAKGFEALGTNAQSATSALIQIARQNISPSSRYYAIDALGFIGPPAKEAVPSLLQWATNTNGHVLCSAMRALGRIREEPDLVLPVLTNALHSAVPVVRMNAVSALGELGPGAKAAVPALVEMFNDWVPDVRRNATNALKQINREAPAGAGVE